MNLNPEQTEAVHSADPLIVVAASAGSGKTRVLVERIKRLVDEQVQPSSICAITFTSQAANEMRERLEGIKVGFIGTLHSLLLRAIRQDFRSAGYSAAPTVITEDWAEGMMDQAINQTRAKNITMRELAEALAKPLPKDRPLTRVESVAAHYQQNLVEAGLIDYDGILRVALGMLQAGTFPLRFEHLLVDEIQDSGAVDALIYELFPAKNKFYVGDDAQSIYGFRGGDPSYLLGLSRRPDAEVILLEGNYRCGQTICAAANNLIAHVQNRIKKETRSVDGHEGDVIVVKAENQQEEIAGIAMRLNLRNQSGDCSFNDAAVLLRTNALVKLYRDGLKSAGIPVRSKAKSLLPEDWSTAQMVVAMCSAPDNDRLLLEYAEKLKGEKFAEQLRMAAAEVMGSISEVYQVGDVTLPGALQKMLFLGVGVETMEAVNKLAESCGGSLAELACAMAAQQPEEEEGYGVHVGTIHSAKGKEWHSVYLPAFEQAVIPAKRDADEEKRLGFVAFTRAKEILTISYCKERPNPYKNITEPAIPSQLIKEAGL